MVYAGKVQVHLGQFLLEAQQVGPWTAYWERPVGAAANLTAETHSLQIIEAGRPLDVDQTAGGLLRN